jgi:hypothetical protein
MRYTINTDENGYILSIANTENDKDEIDLDALDLNFLNCYKYESGKTFLDDTKKQKMMEEEKNKPYVATYGERLDAIDSAIEALAEMIGGSE